MSQPSLYQPPNSAVIHSWPVLFYLFGAVLNCIILESACKSENTCTPIHSAPTQHKHSFVLRALNMSVSYSKPQVWQRSPFCHLPPFFFSNTKNVSSGAQLVPLSAAGWMHCQLRQGLNLSACIPGPRKWGGEASCWRSSGQTNSSSHILMGRCLSFLFLLLLSLNFTSNIQIHSH